MQIHFANEAQKMSQRQGGALARSTACPPCAPSTSTPIVKGPAAAVLQCPSGRVVPLRVRPRVPHAPQAHPRPSSKAQQQHWTGFCFFVCNSLLFFRRQTTSALSDNMLCGSVDAFSSSGHMIANVLIATRSIAAPLKHFSEVCLKGFTGEQDIGEGSNASATKECPPMCQLQHQAKC
jgi:hypothetical protein